MKRLQEDFLKAFCCSESDETLAATFYAGVPLWNDEIHLLQSVQSSKS